MIGFVLNIQIDLSDGLRVLFEGSGAQELGRLNYFGGWPNVSVSPKQLASAESVNDFVQILSKHVIDCDDNEDEDIRIFNNSRPVKSEITEDIYDAYDFIIQIQENIHDIADIQSITMEVKEYGDFCFYRKYTFDKTTGQYTCSMMGVTDSSCDDIEDEEEFEQIADDYKGFVPSILNFSDTTESTPVQKERFYREADEEDIYSVRGCVIEKTENQEAKKDKAENTVAPDYLGTIKLGRYPTGNNGEISVIEWLILDRIDGQVLLISKNIIDFIQVHKKNEAVSWETCLLRKWLNSDFIDQAFEEKERQCLISKTIQNRVMIYGMNSCCNDTEDKVFLLSEKECFKYFPSDKSRKANTTLYADAKRNEKGKDKRKKERFSHSWWIRSVSYYKESGIVFSDGYVYYPGGLINREVGGLRPAIWVNLEILNENSDLLWEKGCSIIHKSDYHIINGTLTSCREDVTSISVPEGVNSIGRHAFSFCKSLKDISLPESLTSISAEAFFLCRATNIIIPKKVKHIGEQAFLNSSIKTLEIPSGIEVIEKATFSCCFDLEKVVIPDTVKLIAPDAFWGCKKATIYAPVGSCAETFALENKMPFVPINS